MANKKFYAVKKGHKTGIYRTWNECKRQVTGYPNASYKGFATLAEAESFMGLASGINADELGTHSTTSEAIAYVDGSYEESLKAFSYGIVIFHNNIQEHFSEKFLTPELIEMRNVAGEIMGAQKAMQHCIAKGIKSVDIYHDYEGIAKWCTGEWKANKTGTKAYRDFYNNIRDNLQVRFIKVAAHSGNKYNDLADELAKSALKPKE